MFQCNQKVVWVDAVWRGEPMLCKVTRNQEGYEG